MASHRRNVARRTRAVFWDVGRRARGEIFQRGNPANSQRGAHARTKRKRADGACGVLAWKKILQLTNGSQFTNPRSADQLGPCDKADRFVPKTKPHKQGKTKWLRKHRNLQRRALRKRRRRRSNSALRHAALQRFATMRPPESARRISKLGIGARLRAPISFGGGEEAWDSRSRFGWDARRPPHCQLEVDRVPPADFGAGLSRWANLAGATCLRRRCLHHGR